MVQTVTMAFYSIQKHFITDVRAKCGIPNSPQSPDIGQNLTGVFPISRFLVNPLSHITTPEPVMILP